MQPPSHTGRPTCQTGSDPSRTNIANAAAMARSLLGPCAAHHAPHDAGSLDTSRFGRAQVEREQHARPVLAAAGPAGRGS